MDKSFLLYFSVCLIIAPALAAPTPGFAHPLGNFSISHYTGIHVARDAVELRYIIDMAEIPTFQEVQETGIVPMTGDPGLQDYPARKAEVLKNGLTLDLDGRPLHMITESSNVIFPSGAGGLPTMKIGITYRAPLENMMQGGISRLRYHDGNFQGRAGWKEITASVDPGVELVTSSVPDKDRSVQLTDYPTDMLNSPPQVLDAQLGFSMPQGQQRLAGNSRPGSREDSGETNLDPMPLKPNRQSPPSGRFADLVAAGQLSFRVVMIAMAVALCLGALHALEPGHGKTIVAAYLVGSRGTARHAVVLGLIVTGAHTAGVYLLGLITLYASRYVVPERLYPWLGIISGLIIATLGLILFLDRFAAARGSDAQEHYHGHSHMHTHGYETEHHGHGSEEDHYHVHASHPHHHHHESETAVSFGRLLTLGITGGIVPCPAALVVLLSAVALRRIGFGLLLIVAFSIGLAAVLIAIGLLMVYARRFLSGLSGDKPLVTRWLPLTSATVITLFGVAMTIQAFLTI